MSIALFPGATLLSSFWPLFPPKLNQAKILKTTGVDPLDAFYLNPKVDFRNTGGGLKLHHIVDILAPPSEPQPSKAEPSPPQRLLPSAVEEEEEVDGSRTLTNKSSTLTPENHSEMDIASPVVSVPMIVVQVDDEEAEDGPKWTPVDDAPPSRPSSIIAESQRLSVEDASDSSSSSTASSASGLPTASPRVNGGVRPKVKTAAKVEKREKMPGKSGSRMMMSATAEKVAAAVEERLAKITCHEEEEEQEEKVKEKDGALDDPIPKPAGARSVMGSGVTVIEDAASLPRAPPRHRTRSRKSNSMKKQLSLIEEEEKVRRYVCN